MRHGLVLGLVCFLCGVSLPGSTAESDLKLVPFPKEVRVQPGRFQLKHPLVLEISGSEGKAMGRLLSEELQRAGLRPALIRPVAQQWVFRLSNKAAGTFQAPALPESAAPERYTLEVRSDEVVCAAKEPAGLACGMQTLRQLLRANRLGEALPCLSIRDWPALRWRAFQDDMTRGPSSRLETLKSEASLGAYLKFNLMTYYMEYQYAFQKHPEIGPTNGSLTPEELTALVDYAKPLHLDILGNQQSFGHFGAILKHPQYAGLRETEEVLTPVNEATYQLLDDFYSEECPRLPFPWFNVCCDETAGLGLGPSRELAAKIGVGGVYVKHIRRIHDLLQEKYKKRMMMWGDIILQHPDKLGEVPKDTLMLTWGYDARPSFEDQIVPFRKAGYEFFVCPGVNNWSRILPDFGVAVTNISNFVRDGIKHGAAGMINTDWEDDGEALNAVKWHADAWAAECAWSGSATSLEAFNRRVGAVLFGETGEHFGRAVELLARVHRMPGMSAGFNARFWRWDFVPKTSPAEAEAAATNLLAVVRPALEELAACGREAKDNRHILDALDFGARRLHLIGQRMLNGLEAAQAYQQVYARASGGPAKALDPSELNDLRHIEDLIRQTREAHEQTGKRFSELWLSESKPYALDWTMKRYADLVGQYDALLKKVAAAREAAQAGKPLPSPEEVGLAPKAALPK